MNCPFCDLTGAGIIKETNFCYVKLSNPRLMSGHLLIIPKRHVEKLSELSNEELKELIALTIEFQEKILKNLASGCDIAEHYRPFQKQDRLKVNHLHIHLHPRELFDELYKKCQVFEKEVFNDLPPEEIEKMLKIFLDTSSIPHPEK